MNIFEIIGFVIVILALLVPVFKRMMERRMQQKNPEEYARYKRAHEEQVRRQVKAMMHELHIKEEEELEVEPTPEPPLKVKPEPHRRFHSDIEDPRDISNVEDRQLKSTIIEDHGEHLLSRRRKRDEAYAFQTAGKSRLAARLSGQSLKTAILTREILDPPLALRDP